LFSWIDLSKRDDNFSNSLSRKFENLFVIKIKMTKHIKIDEIEKSISRSNFVKNLFLIFFLLSSIFLETILKVVTSLFLTFISIFLILFISHLFFKIFSTFSHATSFFIIQIFQELIFFFI